MLHLVGSSHTPRVCTDAYVPKGSSSLLSNIVSSFFVSTPPPLSISPILILFTSYNIFYSHHASLIITITIESGSRTLYWVYFSIKVKLSTSDHSGETDLPLMIRDRNRSDTKTAMKNVERK